MVKGNRMVCHPAWPVDTQTVSRLVAPNRPQHPTTSFSDTRRVSNTPSRSNLNFTHTRYVSRTIHHLEDNFSTRNHWAISPKTPRNQPVRGTTISPAIAHIQFVRGRTNLPVNLETQPIAVVTNIQPVRGRTISPGNATHPVRAWQDYLARNRAHPARAW